MIIITPHCRGKFRLDFPSHLGSSVPTPSKPGGWDQADCSSAADSKGSAHVLHLLLAISRVRKIHEGLLELPKLRLKMFSEGSDYQRHPGVRSVLPGPERSGVRRFLCPR